jgi:outer membrane biosynthesis protein TonB
MARSPAALIFLSFAALAQAPAQPESPKASLAVVSEDAADPSAPPAPQGEERRAIADVVRGNSGPIRDCYEKRLQQISTLQGKLITRFDIGPGGKVIGASAEGIGDRELIACVLGTVRRLEFPKPRSGGKLRVAYPFRFEPRPPTEVAPAPRAP